MSVINKMLRDLDARRADGAAPGQSRQAGPVAMQGTTSVVASAQRRWAPWLLAALLLVLTGVAVYGYLDAGTSSPPPLPSAVAPMAAAAPAPAPALVASAPEPAASAPVASVVAVTEAPPAGVTSEVVAAPEPMASAKKPRQSEVVAAPPPATATDERKEKPVRKRAPSAVPETVTPASGVATASPASGAASQRRQNLAQETLAQAQLLWNAGSREPALELVREAVTAVERSQPADIPLLAQLVREQVRMELALGRPAAVLALLGRLEPALSGQADLWAVRGNAAQRLGRHQESVQSYLAALQRRPGEPRWMLGAAVSLAALGQLDAAAQQAEQARALGPVSPEVLAYLRQAGVPLR